MLDNYENRIGLAITFGLVVNYCTNVVFSDWERIFSAEGAKQIEEAHPAVGGTYILIIVTHFFISNTFISNQAEEG